MRNRILIIVLVTACLPLFASGQKADRISNKKVTVSGIVTDYNSQPVAGAIILVDNINTNSVTNLKGFYKIKVRPSARSITMFTLDNGTEKVLIEGRTTINFTLKGIPSSQNVNQKKPGSENSVDVGYGSVDPDNLTTPVNSIKSDGIHTYGYTDIYQYIAGKVPGVQVHGKSINIQGATSFSASTEPLFVLDGMIVPSIDDVNPSQVESIEILKGASASIYGSRGANGVILIHLKGASGKR